MAPSFALSSRRAWRFWKSISSAVRNSKTPPAMRNADMEMPMKPKSASPKTKNANISMAPIRQDRIATLRRCAVVIPSVSATNNGARPSGSMMMNNVVKAAIRAGRSVMVSFLRRMTLALIFGQPKLIRLSAPVQAFRAIASISLRRVQARS